jgi:hypothetical protein
MVKTWCSEEGGEVTCEACGTEYVVTLHRFPTRDIDSFKCQICGHKMREWNDTVCPSFKLKNIDNNDLI